MEPILLEDWLRVASSSSSSSPPTPSATQSTPESAANSVVHAWAEIRACVQQKSLTDSQRAALELLFRHRRSLHYADSQVKLLLALMAEVNCSDTGLLGFARRFAVLGVLAWVRKCYIGTAINPSALRQAPEQLATVVQYVRKAMEERPVSNGYICEGILLLGTVSTLGIVPPDLKNECCSIVATEFASRKSLIIKGPVADALAGAGYCLTVCSEEHLIPIFRPMLELWNNVYSDAREINLPPSIFTSGTDVVRFENGPLGEYPPLKDVVMLLHLTDYLGSSFSSRQRFNHGRTTELEFLRDELLRLPGPVTGPAVQCSTIMAACGLLRSLYRWAQGIYKKDVSTPLDHKLLAIISTLEGVVTKSCDLVIAPNVSMSSFGSSVVHGGTYADGVFRQTASLHLLRCIAVAVSRCRGFPSHHGVLRCLVLCIFDDVLNLDSVYSAYLAEVMNGLRQKLNYSTQEGRNADDLDAVLVAFQIHTESFVFQEVGALARAMCEQYARSSKNQQRQTEQFVWEFARNLYRRHRVFAATSGKEPSDAGIAPYARTMEKFHEAVFLAVVVFFNTAVRQNSASNERAQIELSALALDSFSCVEYFRHLQLREYIEVIKTALSRISDSEFGSVAFAKMFPAYHDLIQRPGPADVSLTYYWDQDEVQSSRILFYFRVLPLCLDKMPDGTFAERIAPVQFLYLQHPSEAMTKATHALFGAFLSSGVRTDSSLNIRKSQPSEFKVEMGLREQLVGYYAQRALELYPDTTPFQGLVAGFGALARHLPSGSPAVVYCMTCLAERTKALYSKDKQNGAPQGLEPSTQPAGDSGGQRERVPLETMGVAQKLQVLLLHLVLIVDLQVLPEVLKLIANLIMGLPLHHRTVALAEVYDIVASSDDYTRKPVIVPWLQTLSFLLFNSQQKVKNTSTPKDG